LNTTPHILTAANRPRTARTVIELATLALTLGLFVRTWLLEGLLVPLIVVSGSMANTLVGPHYDVTCPACGQPYVVGTDQGRPVRTCCPNCGWIDKGLADVPDVVGDRVLVDKSAFLLRSGYETAAPSPPTPFPQKAGGAFGGPERFDVVAFHHPQRAAEVFIKRVVGLPGEAIQVRDGDLYVDGRIVRKTLDQQRALGVLVHDASHMPQPGFDVPRRWIADDGASRWQINGGRFVHPGGTADGSTDWLEYRHLAHRPGQPDQFMEAPIDDQSAYNQGWPRRVEDIRPVADIRLSLRVVKLANEGWLLVEMRDGQRHYSFALGGKQRGFYAAVNDRQVIIDRLAWDMFTRRPFVLEMSIVDHQFLVAIDGDLVVENVYPAESPAPPPTRPVAIGVCGPQVEIDQVRLYRDVYYTRPIGVRARWGIERPYRLGADEYFVLGDNSSDSDDSRSWPGGPGVPGRLLVGRALAVGIAHRPAGWFGGRFQLPDLSRIRYIR
jgi:signal peptidase I